MFHECDLEHFIGEYLMVREIFIECCKQGNCSEQSSGYREYFSGYTLGIGAIQLSKHHLKSNTSSQDSENSDLF